MKRLSICVLGGTGFVGAWLVGRLARDGHRVRVLTRRRERHRDLLVLPTVEMIGADVHDPAQLAQHIRGCDAVVNLVGILNEKGDSDKGFRAAHVALAQNVIAACRDNDVRRLLHMSALHADANAPSHYLRSKGEAEALVQAADGTDLHVTSFRPSVIFGRGDSFLNRFAALLRKTPLLFPLACPNARFAPVFVGDVAEAFTRALSDPRTYGQRYDLCGPHSYSLHELVSYTASVVGVRRMIVPLPRPLSWLQAAVLEHMPGKPFSRDNYRSLQIDSVCDGPFPALFGLNPTTLESEAPYYLSSRGQRARLNEFRRGT